MLAHDDKAILRNIFQTLYLILQSTEYFQRPKCDSYPDLDDRDAKTQRHEKAQRHNCRREQYSRQKHNPEQGGPEYQEESIKRACHFLLVASQGFADIMREIVVNRNVECFRIMLHDVLALAGAYQHWQGIDHFCGLDIADVISD